MRCRLSTLQVPSELSSSIPSVAHLALVKFLHTVSTGTERVTVDIAEMLHLEDSTLQDGVLMMASI
jgi:hypothetical protein